MPDQPEETKANCNTCGGNRSAFIRARHSVREDFETSDPEYPVWYETTIQILECAGCHNLSTRRSGWLSELDPQFDSPEISYWPPPQRSLPTWHSDLVDENLRTAMKEVYVAVSQGMVILASIGVRTLLDRACYLLLDEKDHGRFSEKLKAMVEKNRLLESEKEMFQSIADVGNAATHRAYAPSQATLVEILTAVESFLFHKFVLPEKARRIKRETPGKDKPGLLDGLGLSEAAPQLEVVISIQGGYICFDGTPIGEVVETSKGWRLDKTTADAYELASDKRYKTQEEIIAVFRELAGRELLAMPRGPGAPST